MNDFEETLAQARDRALQDAQNLKPDIEIGGFPATTLPYRTHPTEAMEDCLVYGTESFRKTAVERITNLSSAISRCIGNVELTEKNVACMSLWARELVEQFDLLSTMLLYER